LIEECVSGVLYFSSYRGGGGSVPGLGKLVKQRVTRSCICHTLVKALTTAANTGAPGGADAVEKLRRRYARSGAGSSSGARPSTGSAAEGKRHCYMCALVSPGPRSDWLFWPPKGGSNPGQPPHHRACTACRVSLADGCLSRNSASAAAEVRVTLAPTTAPAAQTGAKGAIWRPPPLLA
jgi:hypothetical protein